MPMLRMLNAEVLSEFLFAYWEIAEELSVATRELLEAKALVGIAHDATGAKLDKLESAEWKHKVAVEKALTDNEAYVGFLGAMHSAERAHAVLEIEKKAADSIMSFLKSAMIGSEIPIDELLEMMCKRDEPQEPTDDAELEPEEPESELVSLPEPVTIEEPEDLGPMEF